jgi:hypothetical protein
MNIIDSVQINQMISPLNTTDGAVFLPSEPQPAGKPENGLRTSGVKWSRSLFNGLAQIIVQSTREAGEIKLTASADGLALATTVLQTKPCTPRPSVP